MARADAQRNREALLAAASRAFQDEGLDTPLEGIARAAGLGTGTLYRHFPTRSSLVMAVYAAELDALCGTSAPGPVLPPDEAFRAWARRFLSSAPLVLAAIDTDPERALLDRLEASVQQLLDAGVAAGVFGRERGREVLMLLGGLMLALPREQDRQRAFDLVDLVMDGLRHRSRRPCNDGDVRRV